MRPFQSELVRPEHTGANRCWPCTAMNLALLAAGCLVLAAVSPVASVLLAVVGTAAVRLRGYLVPYTPRFAPRLVQHLPWNPFHVGAGNPQSPGLSPAGRPSGASGDGGTGDGATDTGPTAANDGEGRSDGRDWRRERTPATLADATTADGEAILSGLVAAGVVAATDEDVHLASAFSRRWQAEIEALRERSPSALADATLAATPTAERARAVTGRDRDYVVLSDGSGAPSGEVWLRRSVAVAETAAVRVLAETTDLDAGSRAVAAHGLAVFLDTCPVCESELLERTAGGCCGPPRTDADGRPLQALVCVDCRTEFAAFE